MPGENVAVSFFGGFYNLGKSVRPNLWLFPWRTKRKTQRNILQVSISQCQSQILTESSPNERVNRDAIQSQLAFLRRSIAAMPKPSATIVPGSGAMMIAGRAL